MYPGVVFKLLAGAQVPLIIWLCNVDEKSKIFSSKKQNGITTKMRPQFKHTKF